MVQQRSVFFVSDSTGITVETLGHSLLTQFEQIEFTTVTLRSINTTTKAQQVLTHIAQHSRQAQPPLVFITLTDPTLQALFKQHAQGVVLDFFDPFIGALERELQCVASHRVGQSHALQNYDRYMQRMNAVNYTLSSDDGAISTDYSAADCILLGVSRCGKTPTSLYLAMQFGLAVANYPFTAEDMPDLCLPEPLRAQKAKLFGLTIDPYRLCQVRQERRANSTYATSAQCVWEVQQVEALYKREHIPVVNTTTRSVEEIAAELLVVSGLKRQLA